MKDPIDRVHFLDEQRRNRRIGRVVAVLVVAALFVSGIPLSVFISPALVLAAVVVVYAADLFTTVPPGIWEALRETVFILPETWRAIRSDTVDMPWRTLFWVLIVPGTVVMFIVWLFVRVLFRRAGVGGVLRTLGARPPAATGAERRVVNLVEEIAVSAGVTPPRVMIIDAETPNAAAMGLDIENATVVVSTGLMSKLTRDEAQAVIAHVMSSVGNGDLRIAAVILSVIQTWGFVSLLIDTPLGPTSRNTLGLVARNALQSARGELDQKEAEDALHLLFQGGSDMDDLWTATDLDNVTSRHPLYGLFVTFPILVTMGVASIAARAVVLMFTLLVSGPWIGALWRSRRRLADAGAVELTRNPDALAGALQKLFAADVKIPGARVVNFLFPVWDRDVATNDTQLDVTSVLVRMHLNQEKRIAKVKQLGARQVDFAPVKTWTEVVRENLPEIPRFVWALAMGVALLAGMIVANLIAVSLAMMAAWWILKVIFVTVPRWIGRAI